MTAFKNLFESKAFILAILSAAAAAGAIFGFNVPVASILAVIAPIMIAIGAVGWNDTAIAKLKLQHAHELTMFKAANDNATAHAVDAAPVKTAQAGFAKLGVLFLIAALGIGVFGLSSNTGCSEVKPIATDVVDCLKAEAVAVSDGFSITQIVTAVYAAIEGGVDGVLTAIEALIVKYGSDIVACAIDNYPEVTPAPAPGPGSGSGSAAPVVASTDAFHLRAVSNKHMLLGKLFPNKKFQHSSK